MKQKAIELCMDRWYPLKSHPVQLAMLRAVDEGIRFIVVPAGRRSGKTERAKRFVASRAMASTSPRKFFCAAPTRDQVKKIFWADMKLLTMSPLHPKQPSESDLIIFLPNGSEIHCIGLDVPARFEGINWAGGVIDEIADVKGECIEANIMPALNTIDPRFPDYRAWCMFTGVPDGLNHYYKLYQYALNSNDPLWAVFHWKSEEILPPDVIAAAKAHMSAKQYNQEYCASFETASGRIYEEYSRANHTDRVLAPHEIIHWTHDQNYTPLSSAISVIEDRKIYVVDEIVLESAVSEQSAIEFVNRFKNHKNKTVHLYGDPAGRAGEKHNHASDYTVIERVLRTHGWNVVNRVARSHPSIKNRHNTVRALIKPMRGDSRFFVNPKTAKWCDEGMSTVQFLNGSSYQEDQRNKYQHITTAIGYMCHVLEPIESRGLTQIKSTGYY